jgi:phosphohistidine swiveling domain-containing protein
MNTDKIFQLNWTKRWASRFSLLSCSYWGLQYIKIAKCDLGEGFKNILFIHKDGITTCYRVKTETDTFGQYLANKAINNNELLIDWSEKLKRQTDIIREIISEPVESFFDQKKFILFEQEFDKYYPFAGVNNTVLDFLPSELLEKYKDTLESARKYSESLYNETEDFFKKLTKNIAEKELRNSEFLPAIFRDELVEYFDTGKLPEESILELRYKKSALFFDDTGRHFISAEDVDLLEEKIVDLSKINKNEVKGKTACPGKVTGIVRIVRDPKNFKIFNDGDILVTGMTRPDFVPLMKKAGAVVTDAGGILSHAAIVSRELNIPCVIGTEVVTNILKDGDMVEVDADNGVVRVIK